jgi:hypothetical protein
MTPADMCPPNRRLCAGRGFSEQRRQASLLSRGRQPPTLSGVTEVLPELAEAASAGNRRPVGRGHELHSSESIRLDGTWPPSWVGRRKHGESRTGLAREGSRESRKLARPENCSMRLPRGFRGGISGRSHRAHAANLAGQ